MEKGKIVPHKVTKPIQLLAAWLVGLILINGSFLATLTALDNSSWIRNMLAIASVVNVPIFLIVFLFLQTKFRPELQEDTYYSQYLDKKTNKSITLSDKDIYESKLIEIYSELKRLSENIYQSKHKSEVDVDGKVTIFKSNWQTWKVALNDQLNNFSLIRDTLKKAKIPLTDIFGSTTKSGTPKLNIISFNKIMDMESVITLLKILINYDFNGFNFFEPISGVEDEDVYIGAYGYDDDKRHNSEYIEITAELKKLISNDSLELTDFIYYIQTHKKQVNA